MTYREIITRLGNRNNRAFNEDLRGLLKYVKANPENLSDWEFEGKIKWDLLNAGAHPQTAKKWIKFLFTIKNNPVMLAGYESYEISFTQACLALGITDYPSIKSILYLLKRAMIRFKVNDEVKAKICEFIWNVAI